MAGGVPPAAAGTSYLSVNVYRGQGRWWVSVLERTPGRPYPRLVRNVAVSKLPEDCESLSDALGAAARILAQLSADTATPAAP